MKALILVGGYGTRLRPLTLSVPKPLIHFCNKSIVEHQIAALVKVGVDHVILAVAYQSHSMLAALKDLEAKFGIRITCSCEDEPLGTAGPICLAKPLLMEPERAECDSFFVCNSDVICKFPLREMLDFHRNHQGEATILVTTVPEPSHFGVVVSDATGNVERFVEKPQQYVGNHINAGLYILRKSIIDMIEPRPTSIEKEVFPKIAERHGLYSFPLEGYWADIGKPKDFLHGMELYLQHLASEQSESGKADKDSVSDRVTTEYLATGDNIIGNVLIHPTAKVGDQCLIGPNVTIGSGCVIEDGVRISNTAIMESVRIQAHSFISGSILGWESRIGKWVRVEGLTVVGQDVSIASECFINQALILPHKAISASISDPGQIIM